MVVWQVKDFIRTLTPEANTSNLHLKASAAYLQAAKWVQNKLHRENTWSSKERPFPTQKSSVTLQAGVPSHRGSQQLVTLGNKSEITEVFSVSLLFFVLP